MTKINQLIFRTIIQKKDGSKNLYHPNIIGCDITHYYPFASSIANIVVDINTSESYDYISPIRIDDIVRIQERNQRYDDNIVPWQDVFHGRIHSMSMPYNISSNNINFKCIGHGESLNRTYMSSEKTYTSKNTGQIIDDIVYNDARMTDNSLIDTTSSTILSSYEIKEYSKSIQQTINELERLENFNYKFSLVPIYINNKLDAVYPKWSEVIQNKNIKVYEGSGSFESANFSTKNEIVNDIVVYGDGTPQVSGTASDSTSQSNYGVRTKVIVDKSLSTSDACTEAAEAILAQYKDPIVTGTITILGNTNIKAGEYIYCDIPSIQLNGDPVQDWYLVKQVKHTFDISGFKTQLTVGEKELNMSEIINSIANYSKLNNSNGIV